jgi:hypothetical protein
MSRAEYRDVQVPRCLGFEGNHQLDILVLDEQTYAKLYAYVHIIIYQLQNVVYMKTN